MDSPASEYVDIAPVFDEGTPIDVMLARAAAAARRQARLLRRPLPVWRHGRVTWLAPDGIVLEKPIAPRAPSTPVAGGESY